MRRGAAQIVEQHGMHTVGIYREPGVKSRYEGRLRGFFNKCPTHIISLDEDRVDIKDVASLLKLYATRGLLGGGAEGQWGWHPSHVWLNTRSRSSLPGCAGRALQVPPAAPRPALHRRAA